MEKAGKESYRKPVLVRTGNIRELTFDHVGFNCSVPGNNGNDKPVGCGEYHSHHH